MITQHTGNTGWINLITIFLLQNSFNFCFSFSYSSLLTFENLLLINLIISPVSMIQFFDLIPIPRGHDSFLIACTEFESFLIRNELLKMIAIKFYTLKIIKFSMPGTCSCALVPVWIRIIYDYMYWSTSQIFWKRVEKV
jgi:hypothetical protein